MSGVSGGWQPKASDAGAPPTGGGGGSDPVRGVVQTIHTHYLRQATPEVWAELDALRERVAKLEAELAKARGQA